MPLVEPTKERQSWLGTCIPFNRSLPVEISLCDTQFSSVVERVGCDLKPLDYLKKNDMCTFSSFC